MPDFGYRANIGDIVELVHTQDEASSSHPARPRQRAVVTALSETTFTVRGIPDGMMRILRWDRYREVPGWLWDQRPPVGAPNRELDPNKS